MTTARAAALDAPRRLRACRFHCRVGDDDAPRASRRAAARHRSRARHGHLAAGFAFVPAHEAVGVGKAERGA